MALAVCVHATFETGGQIGITDFVEDCDDFLLGGVSDFHFALCGHASYLCGGEFRAGTIREIAADRAARVARCGAKASGGIVAGTLAPDCFRDVAPALIEWRS